jgi:hypothetical protein
MQGSNDQRGNLSKIEYIVDDKIVATATNDSDSDTAKWNFSFADESLSLDAIDRTKSFRSSAKDKGLSIKDARDHGVDALNVSRAIARYMFKDVEPVQSKSKKTRTTVKQLTASQKALQNLLLSKGTPQEEIDAVLESAKIEVSTEQGQSDARAIARQNANKK